MVRLRRLVIGMTATAQLLWPGSVSVQEMPSEYTTVLTALGKSGDFKEGVLKVNIPRRDLRVAISQRPAPTPFGFGGWIVGHNGEQSGPVYKITIGRPDINVRELAPRSMHEWD